MPPEPSPPSETILVTTAGDEANALRIAGHLVENRLAACVNVIPRITSVYRWEGEIARDEEFLLLIKSRRDLFENIRQEIRRLHTYDLPELVSVPLADGDAAYLAWIRESTLGS